MLSPLEKKKCISPLEKQNVSPLKKKKLKIISP
jgi:hypothetical protein